MFTYDPDKRVVVPLSLVLRRLRQEYLEFKSYLNYRVGSLLQMKENTQIHYYRELILYMQIWHMLSILLLTNLTRMSGTMLNISDKTNILV